MKKMLCFCTMLFTVILITGCGKKPETILKDSLAKMNDLKNSSLAFEMKMTMESEGSNISISMKMDGKMDYQNKVAYFDASVGAMGFNTTSKIYTEQVDDKVYTYTSEDGDTWTKEEDSSGSVDVDGILDSSDNYKSIKKVKSDEKGLTKLELTIDKDQLDDFNSLMDNDMTSSLKLDKDLKYYIYVNKDNYIEKIKFDFSDYIEDDEINISEFSMTMTFGKFNDVGEVKVPADVKENATISTDSDSDYSYDYTEEDIVEDIVWSAELVCDDKTINFANYNGELDDYLSDGYDINKVTAGIITTTSDCDADVSEPLVINGKSCVYQDNSVTCN